MKKYFNWIPSIIISNKLLWTLCTYFIRIAEWFRYEKSIKENNLINQNLSLYFSDLVVRDGYFKGLKYPNFNSSGSSIFPKISGTYENELLPVFEKIKNKPYQTIIDIGCAEGFYAIGLALKFPDSVVYAFDIDSIAQQSCTTLAHLNGVDKRVMVLSECTNDWLASFRFNNSSLIICDCEGFERYLFDSSNINNLSSVDLIIELHPMNETDVKYILYNLFYLTHDIQYISSYDDKRKIFDLDPVYEQFNNNEKLKIIQEGRSFTMEWMIAFPRENNK